jgi:hypothetical protein
MSETAAIPEKAAIPETAAIPEKAVIPETTRPNTAPRMPKTTAVSAPLVYPTFWTTRVVPPYHNVRVDTTRQNKTVFSPHINCVPIPYTMQLNAISAPNNYNNRYCGDYYYYYYYC